MIAQNKVSSPFDFFLHLPGHTPSKLADVRSLCVSHSLSTSDGTLPSGRRRTRSKPALGHQSNREGRVAGRRRKGRELGTQLTRPTTASEDAVRKRRGVHMDESQCNSRSSTTQQATRPGGGGTLGGRRTSSPPRAAGPLLLSRALRLISPSRSDRSRSSRSTVSQPTTDRQKQLTSSRTTTHLQKAVPRDFTGLRHPTPKTRYSPLHLPPSGVSPQPASIRPHRSSSSSSSSDLSLILILSSASATNSASLSLLSSSHRLRSSAASSC